ncbi:hypothetical protein Tco_0689724 [Tanacetum coccineum]
MSLWKSDPEPARGRPSSIAFRDTSSMSKKISPNSSQKLKGIQILTIEEQLAADTMQALKASRKSSRSQRHAGGSSKGTGAKPEVHDESTVLLTYLTKEQTMWTMEMKDAKFAETRKSDEEITDMEKADAKKTEEVKDDNKLYVLEKDVQELKEVDHTTTYLALIRSKIMSAVNAYLRSSLGDTLQKDVIEESVQENVINEVKNIMPNFLPKACADFATPVIQSTIKKALEKTLIILDQSSSQAQSSLKASESLSEPPTSDLEWNKGKAVEDSQEHTWFNDLLSTKKGPFTFDELMASL